MSGSSGGARAYVQHDHVRRGVDITLSPLPGRVLRWDVVNAPYDEAVMPTREETLHLDDDSGRALYEALHRFYGGMDNASAAQVLLDREASRVDKMLDAILNGAAIAKEIDVVRMRVHSDA